MRGPVGGVVVSARITVSASRPLAPCTVITRTSSRANSMSRLTSACAARSQAMKPCSDGVSRALDKSSGERLRNSSSASVASGPRRARNFSRPRNGAKHKRRRQMATSVARVSRKLVEARRRCEAGRSLALARKAGAQRALAVPGELEQLLFVRPNSGLLSTLASARSSSSSSRQSASAIRSITAMCSVSTSRSAPATGMSRVFERADDGLEQRPALAQQDQHLAGFLAAGRPQRHMVGDPLRELHARALLAHRVEGRVPAFDLALVGGRDQRPQLDQPGRGVGQRLMFGNADDVGGDALHRSRAP